MNGIGLEARLSGPVVRGVSTREKVPRLCGRNQGIFRFLRYYEKSLPPKKKKGDIWCS